MPETKKTDVFESYQKQMKKAIAVLNNNLNGRPAVDYDANQKEWHERFVKRGIKRGHFWIWWNDRKIRNNKNFLEVNDYENPARKVGFDIHSKNVELKWHWKSLKKPIKFHDESLEEWLIKKVIYHGKKIMEEVG